MKRYLYGVICIIMLLFILCTHGNKQDGKQLVIYTNIESQFSNEVIKEFKKDYPDIDVKILRASSSIIISKVCAEKKRPQADVLWGIAASSIVSLDNEGILYEYKPKNIENINRKFIDEKHKIPHWTGLDIWSSVLTANTKELKSKNLNIPDKYEDLLNAKYKYKISIPNPQSSSTGLFILCGLIQTMGENNAWKFMDKLNTNIKKYEYSGSMPIKLVSIGESDIAIGMDFQSLIESNSCSFIKTIFPKEGLFWDMETVSIVNKKHIKSEAKIFIDWATSKKAMNIYSKNRAFVSMKNFKSNLKDCPKDFSNNLIDMNFYWIQKNKDRLINEWKRRYEYRDNR